MSKIFRRKQILGLFEVIINIFFNPLNYMCKRKIERRKNSILLSLFYQKFMILIAVQFLGDIQKRLTLGQLSLSHKKLSMVFVKVVLPIYLFVRPLLFFVLETGR